MHLYFFTAYTDLDSLENKIYLECPVFSETDVVVRPQDLADFCLPLGPKQQSDLVAHRNGGAEQSETHSFALAGTSGLYGFCRRVQPPAAPAIPAPEDEEEVEDEVKLELHEVLCIVTDQPWLQFFSKFLEALDQVITADDLLFNHDTLALPMTSKTATLLTSLHRSITPTPSRSSIVRIPLPSGRYQLEASELIVIEEPTTAHESSANQDDHVLAWSDSFVDLQVPPRCLPDSDSATVPLVLLLHALGPEVLVSLLAALLRERRVIITSSRTQALTNAVYAAAALIHPFKWHHIFLPLLPHSFLDYLTSPTPFLVGLPSELLPAMKACDMDEVVIVNLDYGTIQPSVGSAGDDSNTLPGRDQLVLSYMELRARVSTQTDYAFNTAMANTFQSYLASSIGRYRQFVRSSQDPPPMPASTQMLSRMADIRRLVTHHAKTRSESDDRDQPPSPLTDTGPSCDVIRGKNSVNFYHTQFAASFMRAQARDYMTGLWDTQYWQVFIEERMAMSEKEIAADLFECIIMQRSSRALDIKNKMSATLQSVKNAKSPAVLSRFATAGSSKAAQLKKALATRTELMRRLSENRGNDKHGEMVSTSESPDESLMSSDCARPGNTSGGPRRNQGSACPSRSSSSPTHRTTTSHYTTPVKSPPPPSKEAYSTPPKRTTPSPSVHTSPAPSLAFDHGPTPFACDPFAHFPGAVGVSAPGLLQHEKEAAFISTDPVAASSQSDPTLDRGDLLGDVQNNSRSSHTTGDGVSPALVASRPPTQEGAPLWVTFDSPSNSAHSTTPAVDPFGTSMWPVADISPAVSQCNLTHQPVPRASAAAWDVSYIDGIQSSDAGGTRAPPG